MMCMCRMFRLFCCKMILSNAILTTVLKNGCFRASSAVIRFSTSTTRHFLIKSFGSSGEKTKTLIFIWKIFFLIENSPEISAHSGEVKLYLPSIMFLNITICFRCQNGGQPTNNVNIITPQAHLQKKRHNFNFNFYPSCPCPSVLNLTCRPLLNSQVHPRTCCTSVSRAPNNRVFRRDQTASGWATTVWQSQSPWSSHLNCRPRGCSLALSPCALYCGRGCRPHLRKLAWRNMYVV